jgi:hypothetical protein
MLKRTITLLSLTITVGALLLTLGCGGSNNNPVTTPFPVAEPDGKLVSRAPGNGSVRLISASSPAVIEVSDPDKLASITVRDSAGGRLYLFAGRDFPKGATTVQITLPNFGQVDWHWVAFVDFQWSADSAWYVYKDGQVVRIR